MQKRIRFLLIAVLLLALMSGCGRQDSAPTETTPVETVPQITTETATEPTLSPEELFLQSLPVKLRQACESGIVMPEALEDPERPCTIGEADRMLQNIYRQKYGEDSWMLTYAVTEENAAQAVTRGRFMTMMYAVDAEALVGVESEDYDKNLKQLTCTTTSYVNDIADTLLGTFENRGYVFVENSSGKTEQMFAAYGQYSNASRLTADLKDFNGDIATVSYALTRFDRTNGEKLMTWDENRNLRFNDTMTVRETVETALRFYNVMEPKPDLVPYEEIAAYDETIITPDLLTRESSLPEPSCASLPTGWHGIWLSKGKENGMVVSGQLDTMTYEHEIQAIKDAGFNFIKYKFDFTYYHGRTVEIGKLNENRLKELDQILAWCMERDIHLNLACSFSADWPNAFDEAVLVHNPDNARVLAQSWKALARRYAKIPNTYLSFNILDTPWVFAGNDDDNGNFLTPVVETIREVSPNRCIMTTVGECGVTGASIAAQGVALTSDWKWGSDFILRNDQKSMVKTIMENAIWPYVQNGKVVDGNTSMANSTNTWVTCQPPDEIAAVARKYGVGYMVGNWGSRIINGGSICETERYSDETMLAFLTDMTAAMAERGYGWCYTDWMGSVGIAFGYPLVESTTYTQVADYPLYIDQEMTAWFQQINNARS